MRQMCMFWNKMLNTLYQLKQNNKYIKQKVMIWNEIQFEKKYVSKLQFETK